MAKLVDAYDLKSYPLGVGSSPAISKFQLNKIKKMKSWLTLFLRKTKIFNKARYSRNRQLARVIFYFSLYINIIIIYYTFNIVYGLSFILA